MSILQAAKDSIALQAESIKALEQYISTDFEKAIQTIHTANGRVVISGIGKSGIVAQKIVATLNSTGTPALFMHAADAIHGDLGMVQTNDVIIVISKSGESEEIKLLASLINKFGNILIAICGNATSTLVAKSSYFLNTTVAKEACPNNLAPTTSTTAQMVMGDAIAISLLLLKDFKAADFARYHPGGALGKQLYLKVEDISSLNNKPSVAVDTPMPDVILNISTGRLGATAVLNGTVLIGIITDGDVRRMLQQNSNWQSLTAANIVQPSPKTIAGSSLAVDAVQVMRKHKISQLIVLNAQDNYAGFIHLHDLLKEGMV